jgi:hypothetical protein
MPRKEHAKKLDALQSRHEAAIKGLQAITPPDTAFKLWKNPWTTTVQQAELLASLVDQLETSQKAAQTASKNLILGLETVILANGGSLKE